ncbi:MAG: AAA family ATPase [Pirellulaceae bacterium]
MPKSVAITEENCWEVSGMDPEPEPDYSAPATNGNGAHFDMAEYASRHGLRITGTGQHNGATKYILEECPFDSSHRGKDAALFLYPNNARGFKCLHQSCSSFGWKELRQKLEPGYDRDWRQNPPASALAAGRELAGEKGDKAQRERLVKTWEPKLLTSAEFQAGDYRQEYVVNRMLVKGQPFVIGGQSKTLKTSLLVDLVLSIGLIGQSFLNTFPVCRPGNVMFLSGESGEFTLQETMRRVAKSKDVNPADARVLWGFSLPSISSGLDLDTLRKVIQEHEISVAVIDPLYLCLIAGSATPIQTSNVFQMGPLLRELSYIGQETGCTMGICHHTTKRLERPGEAPTLEDLSMAGIAEWARQWILPGRREKYIEGSGEHKLWLRVGGSAGHSGLYYLDIDEGKLQDDFSGRQWNVTVGSAAEARHDAEQQRTAAKEAQRAGKLTADMGKVKEALAKVPAGETSKWIRESTGLNTAPANAAIAELLKNEAIERCDIFKPNRKAPYEGFKNKPVANNEILPFTPPE